MHIKTTSTSSSHSMPPYRRKRSGDPRNRMMLLWNSTTSFSVSRRRGFSSFRDSDGSSTSCCDARRLTEVRLFSVVKLLRGDLKDIGRDCRIATRLCVGKLEASNRGACVGCPLVRAERDSTRMLREVVLRQQCVMLQTRWPSRNETPSLGMYVDRTQPRRTFSDAMTRSSGCEGSKRQCVWM
eukprot:5812981-Pyramimonas_sp.AAC.1